MRDAKEITELEVEERKGLEIKDAFYRMYIGRKGTFIPSKLIPYRQMGVQKYKKTAPILITGREREEPVLITVFSHEVGLEAKKKIEDEELTDPIHIVLMNYFQNFFVTMTGLPHVPFFVTAIDKFTGLEKVLYWYSFDKEELEDSDTID